MDELFTSLENEILSTLPSCRQYFAVLPWSEYHKLNSTATGRVFIDQSAAQLYADDCLDEVLMFLAPVTAAMAVAAFNLLCTAAWTPNQSAQDRAEYSLIIRDAKLRIEACRLSQAS